MILSQKNNLKILAIETSCDETAAAVIEKTDADIQIISNVVASQIDLHKKFGGVFPEIASRAHTENIIPVIEKALEISNSQPASPAGGFSISNQLKNFQTEKLNENWKLKNENSLSDIDMIAVTSGPGLIGSLLVGVNTAKALAFTHNKPLMPINHWLGHIYSCFTTGEILNNKLQILNKNPNLKINKLNIDLKFKIKNLKLPCFPSIALIVSGGHTGLVLMRSHTDYTTIGETLDDAAGEAFDKVAKMLQLGYPGGPAVGQTAENYKKQDTRNKQIPNIKFPRAMLDRSDLNFSFSGLKTAVLTKVKYLTENCKLKTENFAPAVAAEFQQCVIDILIGKTLKAAEEFKPKSILLCGGVSANKELREQMQSAIEQFNQLSNYPISFHLPPLSLTGDNAVMIGLAAAHQIANGAKPTTFDQVNAHPNFRL